MEKDKIAKVADIAIFIFLCFLIFFLGFSKTGMSISFGLAFSFFIIKKICSWKGWENIIPKSEFNLAILVFVIANAISIINSKPFILKSIDAFFTKWIEYIIIFYLVIDSVKTRKRLKILIAVILFSTILIGVDGLYQKIFGIDFLRGKKMVLVIQNNILGVTASFNHYNGLAGYLVALIPLFIGVYFYNLKRDKLCIFVHILFLIGFFLVLTCLFFTFSRGGLLGFMFILIFMLALLKKERLFILSLLFCAFTFSVLFPNFQDRIFVTLTPFWDAQRMKRWHEAFLMIRDHPILGIGVGTFMDKLSNYNIDPGKQYAHNSLLQVWAEAGIFAILSFLWFISLLFKKSIKKIKDEGDYLLLGIIFGIFGFLVHSLFDNHLYSLQLATLFWFMSGLAIAMLKSNQTV